MSRCCILYLANSGYLFSTLLSATQAVKHIDPEAAEVLIVNVGPVTAEVDSVSRACRAEGILFQTIDPAVIDHRHIYFSRLFADRFLPQRFDQVLYLDGDTQIVAGLMNLIRADVGKGELLAARDPLALLADKDTPAAAAARKRWSGLGLREGNFSNYINSGILRFNRNGWAERAAECLSLFDQDPQKYKFPDQDVINIVYQDDPRRISFGWNFPGFFLVHGLDKVVPPNIVHFMSNPRPWHGPLPAFRARWHAPYRDLIQRHPDLAPFRPTLKPSRYMAYILKQHFFGIRNHAFWGSPQIKSDLARLETMAVV